MQNSVKEAIKNKLDQMGLKTTVKNIELVYQICGGDEKKIKETIKLLKDAGSIK